MPFDNPQNEDLDQFFNSDGEVVPRVEAEDADTPFPILCADWPTPQYPEAVRTKCAACTRALGISPKGWRMHLQNRAGRPTLCKDCFYEFVAVVDEVMRRQREN